MTPRDPAERFHGLYVKTPTCWQWTSEVEEKGYGRFYLSHRPNRRRVAAHRYAYELMVGPIPDGLTIDHLCGNPGCVNPAHMEPVTRAENTRRQWVRWRREGRVKAA